MRDIRRILVAVKDPKGKPSPAVLKAAQLAKACGAELELFHSIASTMYTDMLSLQDAGARRIERDVRAQHLRSLENVAARLRRHQISVTTHAEYDFPVYEAIVRRARLIKADLVVADCHVGRRIVPRLLHITDWELLRQSPIPVLLVKSPRPYHHPVVLAAIDPTHAFSKPTHLDEEILSNGADLQRALRGTLHALHAYLPLPLYAGTGSAAKVDVVAQIEASAAARAKKQFAHALKFSHIRRSHQHLIEQSAWQAIPGVARRIGSSIVVMGAVSRSGLKGVFIGNTAERVLDDLKCDVVVVKPRGFKTHVQRTTRGARWVAVGLPMLM